MLPLALGEGWGEGSPAPMFMDLFPFLHRQSAGAVSAAGGFLIQINIGLFCACILAQTGAPAFYFAVSAGLFAQLNTNASIPYWV